MNRGVIMKFYSSLAKGITPYKAGEQPQDKKYIKLNTNENPYPPSPKIKKVINNDEYEDLRLYPDPNSTVLKKALSDVRNIDQTKIFIGNGSDEVLSMCFAAFFDKDDCIAYADITYSFYEVYASYYGLKSKIIPLKEYRIQTQDYINLDCKGIIIANPNAPTGVALNRKEMQAIIQNNRDKIIIVDEAYIAFSDCSIVDLINEYDNLIVIQTLSKSHALAGVRCGFAFADANLIAALNRIKDSINSYTINRLSMKLASAAVYDEEYYKEITNSIVATRERIYKELIGLGLYVLPSKSNFLFIKINDAKNIYLKLKQKGILVRYFNKKGINNFIRVTVGKDKDMDAFLSMLKGLIAENT